MIHKTTLSDICGKIRVKIVKFFTRQILIGPSKQKVIKNNKMLGICYGKALKKVGHEILIANSIGMFL